MTCVKQNLFYFSSTYPQQQFPQQGNQGQFGPMMMNSSMGGPGPVSGAGAGQMGQMPGQRQGQMQGQMQGQIGMNPMGMGRMPMGPDQVGNILTRRTSVALHEGQQMF